MSVDDTIEAVENALATIRVPATGREYDLHGMISDALASSGVDCVHEATLGPRRRIDFLAGGVGIEVKRGAVSRRPLLSQIAKYAQSECIEAIIIVSTRQMDLPSSVLGKKVISFGLSRLWGVALP